MEKEANNQQHTDYPPLFFGFELLALSDLDFAYKHQVSVLPPPVCLFIS
jgi:hypothetical protein